MMKTLGLVITTAAMLCAAPVFAGEHACCAKHSSNASNKAMCADFASLGVNADQKSKLEKWQADCMKAGCTKDSQAAFMKKAHGILSADQYAKLKAQCEKPEMKS